MRILAAIALVALAQSRTTPVQASQQLSCVFDTAASRDTVDVWFSLELHREAGDRKRREMLPYAMAIAGAYQQPPRVSFMTWPGTYGEDQENDDDERTPGGFGLDGMIRFTVNREGRLTGQPQVIHDSPQIAIALGEAMALARFPQPGRDEYRVELLIRSRRKPRDGVVSFARIPLPIIRLDEEPRLLQPGPQRYPESEKQAGSSGRVAVYYVITAEGRVLPGSMYVYEATSLDFAQATEEMLMSSFFSPGRSGGCALAVGVQQYINFVIR